ncbi:hypothetical protein GF312_22875, partial [Candidatus Poribacteria bacterium]|nr:hypothetical protein [Candidatus Poribacteria bacterium]
MNFEISGQVQEAESGQKVPGVIVSAFDKDHRFDDLLGEVISNADGKFRIIYDEKKFKDLFEKKPDIYITVKTVSSKAIYTTEEATRFNASPHEEFQLKIPAETLSANGVRSIEVLPVISHEKLTTLTCLENIDVEDDLVKQIKGDLLNKASILEMMKKYMTELEGELDNNALPYRKLQRLFELGLVPDCLGGHYYGVAIPLRTGDLQGVAAEYGNILGYIWGKAIGGVAPWVGKSYTPMAEGDRKQSLENTLPEDLPVYRGINHFNIIEHAPINVAANSILTFMWQLKDPPNAEKLKYGHERNGGHFAAHCAFSIYKGTPREVFRLNYRYTGLDNFPPLTYLIDELVEIADGLYLGQVLFATTRLLERYNPKAEHDIYHYQHFGYFLLWEEDWNAEARRLFPHLEMPLPAVETILPISEPPVEVHDKFTTLTLTDPVDGDVDPAIMNDIRADLADSKTIIHMLKSYSDELAKNPDIKSPTSKKLHTLFNGGIAPETMDGFYRGALVWWQGEELLVNVESLSVAWEISRDFSPWTGKKFFPIKKGRLLELTGGHEKMKVPTFFGSNTVVFRTAKEKVIQNIMKVANVW